MDGYAMSVDHSLQRLIFTAGWIQSNEHFIIFDEALAWGNLKTR
jgi:hypothetical protein